MSARGGPPGKEKGPVAHVFHGQKTVDRTKDVLPPVWIHSPKSGQAGPRVPRGSRVSVIDQAGEVREKIVSIVDGAKSVVCACSFLISDNDVVKAMLRASDRRVGVYLLTASENQLLKEPRADSEFDVERLQDHI